MPDLDTGIGYVNVDGAMVEQKSLTIAEELAAYDPTLHIICVDPAIADFAEAPFIIAELCPDGKFRRIFEVWELTPDIVDRVRLADTHSTDVMAHLDYLAAQKRSEGVQRYKERRAFEVDVGKSILKSKKSVYTYRNPEGKLVKVFDNKPREVE